MKRPIIWIFFFGILFSCGGGGGGGSNSSPTPTLVSACFYGSSGGDINPNPGEKIRLSFNLPVTINTNSILNSAAFSFSPSGTLGEGILSARNINAFTIEIDLTSGVQFTPGETKIDISQDQNVFLSLLGKPAGPNGGVTINTGTPEITQITFSNIPDVLNGKGSAGGRLLVPSTNFVINITSADRDSGTINPSSLEMGITGTLYTASGQKPEGTNIVPYLTVAFNGNNYISITPKQGTRLPEGNIYIWASIRDNEGKLSPREALGIVGCDIEDSLRPFETSTNPSQLWYIDLQRDRQTISISGSSTITINVENTPNNIPDFYEDLLCLGLRSNNPKFSDIGNGTHPNDFLVEKVKENIISRLQEFFLNVNISFTYTSPGNFPSSLQVPYNSLSFSRIAVGGASEVGALGLGIMDERNSNQDDDCAWPGTYSSLNFSLGVFPTELTKFLINSSPTTLFRSTYDPLIPGRGVPAGEGDDDLSVFRFLAGLSSSTTNPTRASQIETAYTYLGKFIAAALAHEMGHSMGLVWEGVQPTGLYGNMPSVFPGSNEGHIDLSNAGIFPSDSQNIMSPGISFETALGNNTSFDALNYAWFLEQILYFGNLKGKVPGW